MGSTESGAGEFSVGSIVWVRRRNGSWWPGKIVGPDELSASHLTSPRSGTPVKLLGREDASVDWYNLEKSKRVKAFRCGDFNECIKRAECSQGMPIKKREKYARREDAILHALELEKQQFSKLGKLVVASDCTDHKSSSGGAVKKGLLVTTPESLGNNNSNVKFGNSKLNQNYKKLEVVTPKTEILENTLYSKKPKEVNQLSGEEDHSEVTPRMRGLQDFGLKIANLKSSFVASNGSRKQLLGESSVEAPKIGSTSHANGKSSLHKRKRSHEESGEDSLVKRRDRRRTLVQVLQNSAKLEEVPHPMEPDSGTVSTSISGVLAEPIGAICRAKRSRCVYLPGDSSESMDCKAISQSDIEMSDSQTEAFPHHRSLIRENISGSSEDESDTSETESTESECDSSETEDMDEEMASHSDNAVPMDPEVMSVGRYEPREHGGTGRDDPEESMLSGDIPHFYTHYPSSAHEAVSKWQLKGKRNIRNLTKRSADPTDRKTYIYGAYPEEKDFRGEMTGLDNGYSSLRPMYRGRNLVELVDWGWDDNHHQSPSRGYWDFKRERSRAKSSMLIDVELKVQSSYRKEPIPIVSLVSNLNGKAIIGHPIQIEALEDGSASNLFNAYDYAHESTENDGNAPLPQAWRTARRTANFRVPRGAGEDAAYDFPFLDRENKPPSKKSNFGGFGSKGSLVKSSPSDRKFKKAPKRASLSSSQKTRTLSSIAIEHKFGNINNIKPIQMDYGSIKPGSSGGPTTVTCIPVKLVFSRLLEKINRPPSKPVLVNSNLERNQS